MDITYYINELLATLFGITLSMSPIIIIMLIVSNAMRKHFGASCRFIIWTLIMLRLCIPFGGMIIPSAVNISHIIISNEHFSSNTPQVDFDGSIPEKTPILENTADSDAIKPNTPSLNNTPVDTEQTHSSENIFIFYFTNETVSYIIFTVWLLGTTIFIIINLALYFSSVIKINRTTLPPDEKTSAVYQSVCREMKIEYAPELIISYGVFSPMLYGYFNPKIVLPDMELSEAALKSVLSHELVHHMRHDIYTKLISMLGNAMHWFNPLAYFAAKTLAEETELSCDNRVLLRCDDTVRVSYGQTMLDIIKQSKGLPVTLTTNFNPSTNSIKERFVGILNSQTKKRGRALISLMLAFCIISGALVSYEARAVNQDEEKQNIDGENDTTDITTQLFKDTNVYDDTDNISSDTETLREPQDTTFTPTADTTSSPDTGKYPFNVETGSTKVDISFETEESKKNSATKTPPDDTTSVPPHEDTTTNDTVFPETDTTNSTAPETEEIEPQTHIHNFQGKIKHFATCTTDGYYEYYHCTGCSQTLKIPIYRTYTHNLTEMHGTAIIDEKPDFYGAIKCRDCGIEIAHRNYNWINSANINYYISGSPYYTGKYNPEGELVISGEGEMPRYFTADTNGDLINPPWYQHSRDYDLIRIGDYITKVSKNAFAGSCAYVNTVSIGRSVVTIEENAFAGATELTVIYLPKSVKKIEEDAFPDSEFVIIRYEGSIGEFEKIDLGNLSYSQLLYFADPLE